MTVNSCRTAVAGDRNRANVARVTIQGRAGTTLVGRLRAALALLVVIGGIGTAVMFRKPSTSASSSTAIGDPSWTPYLRSDGWPSEGTRPQGYVPPLAPPDVPAHAAPVGPLPLAEQASDTSPGEFPSGPYSVDLGSSQGAFPKVSLQWSPEASTEPTNRGMLKHRVRDGETLSSIAYRYLGTRERYREIFQANRDVLASPDRLVAGMELNIPLSGDEPVLDAPPAVRASPTAATSARPTAAPMVPIATGVWRRSSAERAGQRTYSVRKIDTLSGIALQFYGDARRYPELYEANRHQMRGPDDLHEGMLLIVP
jgi:nucleoid-associated protein YgaU